MANYTPHVWVNFPDTSTPINATRLNEMEQGIEDGNAIATISVPGQVQLADTATMNTGTSTTRVPSVSVIAAYVTAHSGGGSGTVTGVSDGVTTYPPDATTGVIDLSDAFVLAGTGVVSAGQISSGILSLARMPPGVPFVVDKNLAVYGAAGSYPVTRPSSRADIPAFWKGNTDPGSLALEGDEWKVLP